MSVEGSNRSASRADSFSDSEEYEIFEAPNEKWNEAVRDLIADDTSLNEAWLQNRYFIQQLLQKTDEGAEELESAQQNEVLMLLNDKSIDKNIRKRALRLLIVEGGEPNLVKGDSHSTFQHCLATLRLGRLGLGERHQSAIERETRIAVDNFDRHHCSSNHLTPSDKNFLIERGLKRFGIEPSENSAKGSSRKLLRHEEHSLNKTLACLVSPSAINDGIATEYADAFSGKDAESSKLPEILVELDNIKGEDGHGQKLMENFRVHKDRSDLIRTLKVDIGEAACSVSKSNPSISKVRSGSKEFLEIKSDNNVSFYVGDGSTRRGLTPTDLKKVSFSSMKPSMALEIGTEAISQLKTVSDIGQFYNYHIDGKNQSDVVICKLTDNLKEKIASLSSEELIELSSFEWKNNISKTNLLNMIADMESESLFKKIVIEEFDTKSLHLSYTMCISVETLSPSTAEHRQCLFEQKCQDAILGEDLTLDDLSKLSDKLDDNKFVKSFERIRDTLVANAKGMAEQIYPNVLTSIENAEYLSELKTIAESSNLKTIVADGSKYQEVMEAFYKKAKSLSKTALSVSQEDLSYWNSVWNHHISNFGAEFTASLANRAAELERSSQAALNLGSDNFIAVEASLEGATSLDGLHDAMASIDELKASEKTKLYLRAQEAAVRLSSKAQDKDKLKTVTLGYITDSMTQEEGKVWLAANKTPMAKVAMANLLATLGELKVLDNDNLVKDIEVLESIDSSVLAKCSQKTMDECLFIGIVENNIEVMNKALEAGANINVVNSQNQTPLMLALSEGNGKLTAKLLRNEKMELGITDHNDQNVFHHLSSGQYSSEMLALLLSIEIEPNNLNRIDSTGFTCLHLAIKNGNTQLSRELVKLGADTEIQCTSTDKKFRELSAIGIAIVSKSTEVLAFLSSDSKFDASHTDSHGNNYLHLAAEKGNLTAFKLLQDKGVDLNALGANQKTVLHCAVESYSDEVAIYLVDKGNSVDEVDEAGNDVIMHAMKKGKDSLVSGLSRKCASSERFNKDGFNIVHMVAERGYTSSMEALINAGVDVTKRVNSKESSYQDMTALDIVNKIREDDESNFKLYQAIFDVLTNADAAVSTSHRSEADFERTVQFQKNKEKKYQEELDRTEQAELSKARTFTQETAAEDNSNVHSDETSLTEFKAPKGTEPVATDGVEDSET